MLKSLELLLEPDRRNDQVVLDPLVGTRPMRIDDLHDLAMTLELPASVPPDVRHQFDLARSVFVYSWF